MRKAFVFLVTILILITMAGIDNSKAAIVDRVIASVNGEIITLKELEKKMQSLMKNPNAPKTEAEIESARQQILQAMIDRILIKNEAQRLELTVSEDEIDDALERVLQGNKITMEEFKRELAAEGSTVADIRREIALELMKAKIIQREIRARVVVTDEDIDRFLQENPGGIQRRPENRPQPQAAPPSGPPDQVHLRNILILLPKEPTEEIVKEKVELVKKIYGDLKGGLDFTEAAKQYSQAPNGSTGGDLGVLSWKDLNENIRQALVNLGEGQISPPVQIGGTVQIFQVVRRIGGEGRSQAAQETPPPEPAPAPAGGVDREAVRRALENKMLMEKFEEYLKELRKDALIKVTY